MHEQPWPYRPLPVELGAVVHGPALLARSGDVAVGIRCVLAHPHGLHLPLVLEARGPSADLAGALSFNDQEAQQPRFRLMVSTSRRTGTADDSQVERSGSAGQFQLVASYWVDELPVDRRLTLTVEWPEIGLPESTTELQLDDLTDLNTRVVPLA